MDKTKLSELSQEKSSRNNTKISKNCSCSEKFRLENDNKDIKEERPYDNVWDMYYGQLPTTLKGSGL